MKAHFAIVVACLTVPVSVIASSSLNGPVRRWGPLGPGPHPTSVTISPDGKTVALADLTKVTEVPQGNIRRVVAECVVRLWDIHTGDEVRSFHGHSRQVGPMAFSADGRYLAAGSSAGSAGNTVRIWNTQQGNEVAVLRPEGLIFFIAFSEDGGLLVSASGQSVQIWDAKTWQLKKRIIHPTAQPISYVAASANGRYIATGLTLPPGEVGDDTLGQAVIAWDTTSGEQVLRLPNFTSGLFLSPDGAMLAVKSNNGVKIDIWNITTRVKRKTLPDGPRGGLELHVFFAWWESIGGRESRDCHL